DYSKVVAWQAGLAYLALWAVTFWTLDEGGIVFGRAGACYADSARVLFYWVCDSGSPLNLLAAVSNLALTVPVWAPVYVAAAPAPLRPVPTTIRARTVKPRGAFGLRGRPDRGSQPGKTAP